jgi:5-methylcytosine-specific restriction endonuclease McrA
MRKDVNLSHVSNGDLLSAVRGLVAGEREVTAKLVAYLGEVEERRLHLETGFPSMFAFCTKELGMSENEAFRRLVAARLGRRFPIVHELLASGAVHLSALELLREYLTEENHAELLGAVAGMSKGEILALLAKFFPKPDVPTTIKKLPPSTNGDVTPRTFELEAAATPHAFEPARSRIEPLSEARYKIEFTASAGLREKLELCRDLMSHANPTRDLGVVVERAVDLLLAELEKKRLGRTKRARSRIPRAAKRGRITRAVRRQVFERDGLRCSFVSSEGRRCDARAFLELDHIEPRAHGGADDTVNLRVRCRAHNQLAAERVFGREHMDSCRHFVRTKCSSGPSARNDDDTPSEKEIGDELEPFAVQDNARSAKAAGTVGRVCSALKGMGFRVGEVQTAIARVLSMRENQEDLPVELMLREALLAATPDIRRRRV